MKCLLNLVGRAYCSSMDIMSASTDTHLHDTPHKPSPSQLVPPFCLSYRVQQFHLQTAGDKDDEGCLKLWLCDNLQCSHFSSAKPTKPYSSCFQLLSDFKHELAKHFAPAFCPPSCKCSKCLGSGSTALSFLASPNGEQPRNLSIFHYLSPFL